MFDRAAFAMQDLAAQLQDDLGSAASDITAC
jgi:hypothetical protein